MLAAKKNAFSGYHALPYFTSTHCIKCTSRTMTEEEEKRERENKLIHAEIWQLAIQTVKSTRIYSIHCNKVHQAVGIAALWHRAFLYWLVGRSVAWFVYCYQESFSQTHKFSSLSMNYFICNRQIYLVFLPHSTQFQHFVL